MWRLFSQTEPLKKSGVAPRNEQRRRRLGFETFESRLMTTANAVTGWPDDNATLVPLDLILASGGSNIGSITSPNTAGLGNPQFPVPFPQRNLISITEVDNAGGSSMGGIEGNVTPGGRLDYTIVVSNTGKWTVSGATITDPLPKDFIDDIWSATTTGGATIHSNSGFGPIDQLVTLPPGSSVTIVIEGMVNTTAKGTLSDTAVITPVGGTALSATDKDIVQESVHVSSPGLYANASDDSIPAIGGMPFPLTLGSSNSPNPIPPVDGWGVSPAPIPLPGINAEHGRHQFAAIDAALLDDDWAGYVFYPSDGCF